MNNSENSKKLPFYSKWIMLILILSVPLAIFRGVILFKYTDISNGLLNNEIAGNIFFVLLFVIVAAVVCMYFAQSKWAGSLNVTKKQTVLQKVFNILCAALLLAVVVWDAYTMMANEAGFSYLLVIKDLLCASSVVYFISCAFKSEGKAQDSKSKNAALIPAVYVAVYAIIIFIDIKTQINAPQRSYTLLMLMFVMMSFVAQAEMYVPLTKAELMSNTKQKTYAKVAVFSLLAAVLAIVVVLPQIIFSVVVTHDTGAVIYSLSDLVLALINGVCVVNFLSNRKSS